MRANYKNIGYNNSIHSSTKFSAFELAFGHTDSSNHYKIFITQTFYTYYSETTKNSTRHLRNLRKPSRVRDIARIEYPVFHKIKDNPGLLPIIIGKFQNQIDT